MPDIKAETVADALLKTWISRFGVPSLIVTDRGAQFESELFENLANLIGFQRRRTTAYNPACNGMIERWHRSLKASIMCVNNPQWTKTLPLVMLGLRTAFRDDIKASSAELVYGERLRLPGEMIQPTSFTTNNQVITQLQKHFQALRPSQPSRHTTPSTIFMFKDLATCSHVLVRTEATRRPLQPPYEGPHPVIRRTEKYYTLLIKGNEANVSINRLKPCFIEINNNQEITTDQPSETKDDRNSSPEPTSQPTPTTSPNKRQVTFELDQPKLPPQQTTSQSGRIIRRPPRYN